MQASGLFAHKVFDSGRLVDVGNVIWNIGSKLRLFG
jgi:hypothetical protein